MYMADASFFLFLPQLECSTVLSGYFGESSLLPVSVSADVCQSTVLVPVLLRFLWECYDELLGAHII